MTKHVYGVLHTMALIFSCCGIAFAPAGVMAAGEGIDPVQAQREMIALIRKKTSNPKVRKYHEDILTRDGRSLSALFEYPEQVLQFLLSHTSDDNDIPGMRDAPLIVPGDPEKSVFYQQLVHEEGWMFGEFETEEIRIVERWIRSLPKEGESTEAPHPSPDRGRSGVRPRIDAPAP